MKLGLAVPCSALLALLPGCGSGGGGSGGIALPDQDGLGQTASKPAGTRDGAPRELRPLSFEEVSVRAGIEGRQGKGGERCNPFIGSGGAFGDPDLDGDPDLYATNHGGPNFLYLNQGDVDGDGTPDFTEAARALGIALPDHYSHAATFVDTDNDGDADLFVTSQNEGNTLFRNELVESGNLAFSDVTSLAGLADEGRAVSAAWGDLDRDGFLDVYLAKHAACFFDLNPEPPDRLYHARGDGSFEDWSRFLCSDGTSDCRNVVGLGFTAAFTDTDNDGDADIYLVNDSTHGGGPNRHWQNDGPDGAGGWILTERSARLGTNTRVNGMGLGVGDVDNDGWMDLSFSNIQESHLLRNLGDGSFEDITDFCGIAPWTDGLTGWGTAFFDADNDGWLDLYFVNGPIWGALPERDSFFRNEGFGNFSEMTVAAGLEGLSRGRAIAQADIDGDGFVDLFVGNLYQQPYLFQNRARALGSTQNWLVVTVEGTRSNRDGLGTRITLLVNGMHLTREITSGTSHGCGDEHAAFFGLGTASYGALKVRWPTGEETGYGLVDANQRLHLVEPEL